MNTLTGSDDTASAIVRTAQETGAACIALKGVTVTPARVWLAPNKSK
ncbi:hypothetical protein [Bradyrhizobium neotropicale]|nr:hypothetical protein [Bradyrhizobium neotropicale]